MRLAPWLVVPLAVSVGCEDRDAPLDPLSSWTATSPMPEGPRQDLAVVAIETTAGAFAFAIGGRDERGDALARVERFSMANETWETVAPLPVPMFSANAAAVDEAVWILGFLDENGEADGRSFRYDHATDEWHFATPMPPGTERGAAGIAAIGADVFVAGGARSGMPVDDFAVFSVIGTNGSWALLPELPAARSAPAAGAEYSLVIAGGMGPDGRFASESFVFNVYDSTWETVKRMPTARARAAAIPVGGNGIVVIGGESDDGILSVVESYDYTSNSWRVRAPLPTPRSRMSAAIVEDYPAVVPGGAASTTTIDPVDTVENLYLHLPPGVVE